MKKILTNFCSVCILISAAASLSRADDLAKRIGLGLGYPYLCLKGGITSNLAIEGRGQFSEGVIVLGGRGYYNFNPKDRAVVYAGGEVNYVTFDTETDKGKVKGNGYTLLAFLGLEYFVVPKTVGLAVDIGPVYTKVGGTFEGYEEESKPQSGVDIALNFGVNFYFGIGK